MSTFQVVDRDERTTAVENAGHVWAYNFLAIALLIDVAVRSLLRGEAAWDLMLLVVVGGGIVTYRQSREEALPRGWVARTALAAAAMAVVSAVIAFIVQGLDR